MVERNLGATPESDHPDTEKLEGSLELTIQEAADILGVSCQFLIELLEQGEINPYYVGPTQYFRADDLIYYRNSRDTNRSHAINELIRMSEELGLYDIEVDFPKR